MDEGVRLIARAQELLAYCQGHEASLTPAQRSAARAELAALVTRIRRYRHRLAAGQPLGDRAGQIE